MANISSAFGKMALKGEWSAAQIGQLNQIATEIWAKWYYAICLDDPLSATKTASFHGEGRWTFEASLERLGSWTKDDADGNPQLKEAHNELLRSMRENGLTINISYTDEEPGNEVLYTQTGVLSSTGETLRYDIASTEIFDYNWKNYLEIIGDSDAFGDFVAELCDHAGVPHSSEIEQWAKEKIRGCPTEYEQLTDDEKEEFDRLFPLRKTDEIVH